MGGMKSGTGDVWGDDDDEEEEDEESIAEGQADETTGPNAGTEGSRSRSRAGSREKSNLSSDDSTAPSEAEGENDIADNGSSTAERSRDDGSTSGQPYVVRRMLKDKSVQFERDERLTLFVHDDVKKGEQELEAETQDLFGRTIPVFDIREAVYRAALRNRDDVIEELEEMGYTRD